MEAEEKDINIALLIDADNISAKYISAILSELSRYGKITIRRMYGDWTQERLRSWFNQAAKYSLTPIMQPNNTPGKNASDIGLIIDAMDILYEGKVQGFCIVSSDGDFNRLATRLREAGMTVIGMGEKKTPEAFRVSCERFIFLDVIESSEEDAEDTARRASQGAKKNNTTEKAETKKTTKTPEAKKTNHGALRHRGGDRQDDHRQLRRRQGDRCLHRFPPCEDLPGFRYPELSLQQALGVLDRLPLAPGDKPGQRGLGDLKEHPGHGGREADPVDLCAA